MISGVNSIGALHSMHFAGSAQPSSAQRNEPSMGAQGLLERCISSVSGACSYLKDKVIAFATGVSHFCSRIFGTAHESQPQVLGYDVAALDDMGWHLVIAARASSTNTGLFRVSPSQSSLQALKEQLREKGSINYAMHDIHAISNHVKAEFQKITLNVDNYRQLVNVASKAQALVIDYSEVDRLLGLSCDGSDQASMRSVLKTLSECYLAASDNSSESYNREVFHTLLAKSLVPDLIYDPAYRDALSGKLGDLEQLNKDSINVLKMLFGRNWSESEA